MAKCEDGMTCLVGDWNRLTELFEGYMRCRVVWLERGSTLFAATWLRLLTYE